ncbi:MAG TPA: flagellar assembly protein FliW [Acidimicrobiales bacterium]|nr:flagellar assembly protein FliW [Acidimicrobiales bacterium]
MSLSETTGGTASAAGRGIELVRPMLGFPDSTRFSIAPLGVDYEPYAVLSSLDQPGLEFVVVPPGVLFDDYVIEVPEEDAAALELTDAADAAVLALVTRRATLVPTVNLLGPIVINQQTRRAVQVVLQDDRYGATVPVDAGTSRPSSD